MNWKLGTTLAVLLANGALLGVSWTVHKMAREREAERAFEAALREGEVAPGAQACLEIWQRYLDRFRRRYESGPSRDDLQVLAVAASDRHSHP